jgi:hypothetical protein
VKTPDRAPKNTGTPTVPPVPSADLDSVLAERRSVHGTTEPPPPEQPRIGVSTPTGTTGGTPDQRDAERSRRRALINTTTRTLEEYDDHLVYRRSRVQSPATATGWTVLALIGGALAVVVGIWLTGVGLDWNLD